MRSQPGAPEPDFSHPLTARGSPGLYLRAETGRGFPLFLLTLWATDVLGLYVHPLCGSKPMLALRAVFVQGSMDVLEAKGSACNHTSKPVQRVRHLIATQKVSRAPGIPTKLVTKPGASSLKIENPPRNVRSEAGQRRRLQSTAAWPCYLGLSSREISRMAEIIQRWSLGRRIRSEGNPSGLFQFRTDHT